MSAPPKILDLIERFDRNLDTYKRRGYKEEDLRIEYLNPFFKELGWDMENERGVADNYKEVIHEDSIKVSGATKAPDYAFRVGTERKFFLEAKSPFVNIEYNKDAVYQLRRYAWSQKLPLSILSDFEEFAVYDCRFKPNQDDNTSNGRISIIKYKDYPQKWDEIASVFSRDAVWKGSFDKYAEGTKGKRGTSEVDDEFLKEIESWRDSLARNIAIRNSNLTNRQLNSVVQNTIDRLIFLRICEDRAIEEYGQLQKMLNGTNVYRRIVEVYYKADQKYNSGLFHFTDEKGRKEQPDTISLQIEIDDKPLKEIIKRLYYPESPYEFSVIPVEILGNVYERFLGKVIRLTAGHQAKIEDKPEVRKAGGVYYTPKYIVDYIVENTVGKLLENKTIEEADKLKILDPACGSGSFLLGAYRSLLDKYLYKYIGKPDKYTKGKNPPIYQTKADEYRLTIQEKKRILLNNIYGVDIDPQAVEVTKLSLLLKALEGETGQTLKSLELFHERALPDLSNNIKCGNSLIGPDFYDGKEQLFDMEEQIKVNAFDWEREFPEVFKAGCFDAVIGNPPYVNLVAVPLEQRNYFQNNYKTCKNKSDLYSFFIEKACDLIKNKEGKFSFIIPHTWLATDSFELLRKKILNENRIESIAEMGFKVFDGVIVSTVILICSFNNESITVLNKNFSKRFTIPTFKWINDNFHIDLEWTMEKENIYQKISTNTIPLEKIIQFSRGIKTSDDKRFIQTVSKNQEYKPVYRGKNIKSYSLNWDGEYIWYRPDLMKEKVGCLPHTKKFFEVPEKLITQRVNSSMQLLVAYDNSQNYFLDTTNVSRYESWDKKHSMKYIAGILNSKLINYWYCNKYKMPTIGLYELHSIPFKIIDFTNKSEKAQHDRMVTLVEQMLELNKKVHTLQGHEKTVLERQIEATDHQIDKLVYELYGLTKEEIKIVEGEG